MVADRFSTFLEILRQSQLLSLDQLEELRKLPRPTDNDPKFIAQYVLKKTWLTRFQLNHILQGKSKELVVGSYRLLDRIGEGGNGTVYRAQHQAMDRQVALKVIRKERLASEDAVRRFKREFKAAGQLVHPNIVVAYDAGEVGQTYFFAMEFVNGLDLAKLVREKGPLPPEVACDFVRQAALGLQHAHERGMVHRDIKPANLLFTPQRKDEKSSPTARSASSKGTIKILDMGLARMNAVAENETTLTQEGRVVGTPDFLAPEQAIDARKADIRSDLYSLGCTLYFLLAGKVPFRGGSLTEVLLKHQIEEAEPLYTLRPGLPEGILDVVRKLMAKNPANRFQTPAELALALTPLCQSSGEASTKAADAVETESYANAGEETPTDDFTSLTADSSLVNVSSSVLKKKQIKGRTAKRRWIALVATGSCLVSLLTVGSFWIFHKPGYENKAENEIKSEHTGPREASVLPVKRPQEEKSPLFSAPSDTTESPKLKIEPKPGNSLRESIPLVDASPPEVLNTGEILRFNSQTGPANVVGFFEDGRRAFTSGAFSAISVWDLEAGRELRRLKIDISAVQMAVVTPDGHRGAFLDPQKIIHVWDLVKEQQLAVFEGHKGHGHCLCISADGRIVALGTGGPEDVDGKQSSAGWQINFCDVDKGRHFLTVSTQNSPAQCAALSIDGKRLLWSGNDSTIHLMDIEKKKAIRNFEGHGSFTRNLVFSSDGQHFLSASIDGSLRFWDAEKSEPVRVFNSGSSTLNCIAISPDGHRALSGAGKIEIRGNKVIPVDCLVRLWNLDNGKEIARYGGHTQQVNCVAFSRDGRRAISGAFDATVRLWDLATVPKVMVKNLDRNPLKEESRGKERVPEAGKQDLAEKLIKEIFKEDYAKSEPTEKLVLADKLLKKARETNDDLAARFVLLREARDLAVGGSSVERALFAVEEMDHWFIVKPLDMKTEVLEKITKTPTTSAISRSLIDSFLNLGDEAVAADDYDFGLKLVSLADEVARKVTSPVLQARLASRRGEIQNLKSEFEKVKTSADTLNKNPDNVEAKLTLGKFYCFVKRDWGKGLPLLASSNDPALKKLAEKDQEDPVQPTDQVELGDSWWDQADTQKGPAKLAYQRRAYYWYQQSVSFLGGLTQSKVEKRIKVLEQNSFIKPPDPKGFVRRLSGHSDEVNAVAISRDGRRALSGSNDKTVRLWDLETGREIRRYDRELNEVQAVGFAREPRRAIFSTSDGLIRVWDVISGEELRRISHDEGGRVAFLPDGDKAVGGKDRWLNIWPLDENRGSHNISGRWDKIRCVASSADGNFAIFGTASGSIQILELETSRNKSGSIVGHTAEVTSVALSPDGRLVASASADKTVRCWETTRGRELFRLRGISGKTNCVIFSPDGRWIVTGGTDKVVRLWDSKNGREAFRLEGHAGEIRSVAISRDGHRLLSASADKTIRLWGLAK